MRLGHANVDALGRSITAKQLLEWEQYASLDPFSEEREDYRTASVVQSVHELTRVVYVVLQAIGVKNVTIPEALSLEKAKLQFGKEEKKEEEKPPTWKLNLMWAQALVDAQNALVDSEQKVVEH